MRKQVIMLAAALLVMAGAALAQETPLLVHSPTLSATQIVFVYGGYVASVRRLILGGRDALGVRAQYQVASRVETLQGRTNHAGVYRDAERPGDRESAAHQFERFEPGVVQRHGVFLVGPFRACQPVQL